MKSSFELDRRIAELRSSGIKSAAKISRILKSEGRRGVSASSIKRRLPHLRGAPSATTTAPGVVPAPAAGAPAITQMADIWIRRLGRAAQKATSPEDVAQLCRVTANLLEIKRKATAPPAIDPNEAQMLAAKQRALEMISHAIEVEFAAPSDGDPQEKDQSKIAQLIHSTRLAIEEKIK